MGLQDTLRGLDTLSVADLRRVADTASALLVSKTARGQSEELSLLYAGMQEAYRDVCKRSPRGKGLQDNKIKAQLVKALASIDDFLDHTYTGGRPAKQQRLALYRLFAGLVIKHLGDAGVIVTLNTLAANMEKAPSLINKNFPGYAQSGLLSWVLNGVTGGWRRER